MPRFDYIAGPALLASALVNGDESSLESAADKAALAKFLADLPAGARVEDLRRDADGQGEDSHFMHWRFPEGTLGCEGVWYLVRLPDDSPDGWEPVKAADIKPGDVLDLEGDPYAERSDMAVSFEFETQAVVEVSRDSSQDLPPRPSLPTDWVRIDFEYLAAAFPPDHTLRRVRHDAALAASL